MKIFHTEKAVTDLARLRDFIAQNNPRAAVEVSQKIHNAINRLIDFPMLGKEVKYGNDSLSLRDLITGDYVIRYIALSSEIHIVRVWHGKEDRFSVI